MVKISFGNSKNETLYTRYFNSENFYAIYESIMLHIKPNVNLTTIDEKTHMDVVKIVCWCEMASIGETYESDLTQKHNIEILVV